MIKPEQLAKVKKILTDLKATEKNCGACGQSFDKSQADKDGWHLDIFCDAADEVCEICKALVTRCDCNRCEDCGTIYSASDALENLNDDGNCAKCANEIGE
jgi:hypothetical protein